MNWKHEKHEVVRSALKHGLIDKDNYVVRNHWLMTAKHIRDLKVKIAEKENRNAICEDKPQSRVPAPLVDLISPT